MPNIFSICFFTLQFPQCFGYTLGKKMCSIMNKLVEKQHVCVHVCACVADNMMKVIFNKLKNSLNNTELTYSQ